MCVITCSLPWLRTDGPCTWWENLPVGCAVLSAPARKLPERTATSTSLDLLRLRPSNSVNAPIFTRLDALAKCWSTGTPPLWQQLTELFVQMRLHIWCLNLPNHAYCLCWSLADFFLPFPLSIFSPPAVARRCLALGCPSRWRWRRTTAAAATSWPSADTSWTGTSSRFTLSTPPATTLWVMWHAVAEVSVRPTSWLLSFEGFSEYGKQERERRGEKIKCRNTFKLCYVTPTSTTSVATIGGQSRCNGNILYEQQEAKWWPG